MQIDKRSREELKKYFAKNAIPTASNFAEFIDGMLSQKDDGIAKPSGGPLSIEAAIEDTKPTLHFYNKFSDQTPAWALSLNPRLDPANSTTAKPGLNISDSTGASRLFIDRGTGSVGVGTLVPRAGLHIERGAVNTAALLLSSSSTGWGSGLQFENTAATKTFGIYGGNDGALHFADVNSAADRLLITKTGDVGVGAIPSGAKLHVTGTVKANRFTSDNTLVLNDYTTPNPASNVYLYSPPNDRDAWLYLDSADAGSNWGIYHRQIDAPIKGLPGNSIGFVGGGSKLQAYINLQDGSAFVAGNLGVGTTAAPRARLDVPTGDAYVGRGLHISAESDGTNGGFLNLYNATNKKHWHITHRSGEADKLIFWRNDATATPWFATLKLGMDGTVEAPGGALIHSIGIGTQVHGKTNWAYETIQMHPLHNLRIWFGTTERFYFANNGTFSAGTVLVGNSDIYFTNTEHNHTGNANVAGHAAIENAKDHDSLMILGRAGTSVGRKVRLWDYLKVEGTLANLSDATTKQDIASLEYGLTEVKKLRPIAFNWIDRPNPHKSLGLVGQEVQEVIKEVVYEDDGQLSISYLNLIPVLINAIKDLDRKIDALSS